MAVKKVTKTPTTKPAAKPAAKKPTKAESAKAAAATPAPTPTKAKPVKANKSVDQARAEMLKPALDAKQKQDSEIRSEQLRETELVVIDPKDATIPLTKDVKPATVAGLVEVPVEGTTITLLGLADPSKTPTLAQRVAMARRMIEVSDKLPKYVKTIKAKQPDLDNAVKATASTAPAAADKPAKTTKPTAATAVENGVPLKKICADIDVDPKLARRVLRAGGSKPGGRWEWPQAEVDGIKKTIKAGVEKLKAAKDAAK